MRKIIYLSFVFLMILSGSGMNAYASSVDINDGSKDFNAFVESKVMEINNLISQSANDLEDKANIIHEEVDEYV
ncbi:hypothetical protein J4G37_37685, partial [Microvirga sp. 3-52]|nr:hypothetical protein [Microvirga sp. 3-52]